MTKELKMVDGAKSSVKKHANKVKLSGAINSDKLNEKASEKTGMTPEQNYEFNTKTTIPAGMEIGYKDGNSANTKFINLKLVKSQAKK